MAWRHKDILESELHEAKGFTTANNGDSLWRNENGDSEWTDREVLPSALNFVDGSSAPPTTSTGDIYVLSTITTTLDPLWGGSPILNDWVRYDGAEWQLITPSKSILCYDKTLDVLMAYDGSTWNTVGTNTNIANDDLTFNATYEVDLNSFQWDIKNGANGIFRVIPNGTGGRVSTNGSGVNSANNFAYDGSSNTVMSVSYGADLILHTFYLEGYDILNSAGSQIVFSAGKSGGTGYIDLYNGATKTINLKGTGDSYINTNLIINGTATVGAEEISLQGDTLVKGSDTSTSTSGFKHTDSADVSLFEIRNNGDIYTETLQGLNVTLDPTAITSMTFTNGILTAQS